MSILLFASLLAPSDTTSIDTSARDALKAWQVPGVAVAVVHHDKVVYLRGHGRRSLDAADPVTPDTLFPIASCTKAFTAAAIATLVDDGKLAWDDRVRTHLPWFRLADPVADCDVTIRDLCCHRTGLRAHDFLWYGASWPADESVRRAGRLPLDRPFRTAFQYQSTMFTAAGLAAASAAGEPWPALVQRRLLDPLGMNATVFTSAAAEKSADRARPHRGATTIPEYQIDAPDPAGSIYSNARDLASWLRFQLAGGTTANGKRLVAAAALAETHAPQLAIPLEGLDRDLHPETRRMSYGLGWVVYDYRGRKVLGHAGAIDGFRVHIVLVPEAKLGVAVLANQHQTRLSLALCNSIVDRCLGQSAKDWNAILLAAIRKDEAAAAEAMRARASRRRRDTQPARELSAYTGDYEHPAYGTAKVRLRDGGLAWEWGRFSARLDHHEDDTFVLPIDVMQQPLVKFTLDAERRPLRLHVGGRLDVEFRRVKR